jgi:periplasmic protein TonB
MFESLRQDDRPNGMKYFTSLVISLVVHTTVLSALVLVPLLYFHALHTDELLAFVMMTPPIPLPPPVPQPPRVISGAAANRPTVYRTNINEPPRTIPDGVIPCPDEDPLPAQIAMLVKGIGTGPMGEGANGISVRDIIPLVPRTVAEPPAPRINRTVVRVGTVEEAKLIHRVEPVYPKIAVAAHVSETVILDLVIDEEGNVASVTVLRGHPLLNDAAVQAVKQWKYRPTIQNGEPVQITGTVTIFFRIR